MSRQWCDLEDKNMDIVRNTNYCYYISENLHLICIQLPVSDGSSVTRTVLPGKLRIQNLNSYDKNCLIVLVIKINVGYSASVVCESLYVFGDLSVECLLLRLLIFALDITMTLIPHLVCSIESWNRLSINFLAFSRHLAGSRFLQTFVPIYQILSDLL
jgi:hypothetical protein